MKDIYYPLFLDPEYINCGKRRINFIFLGDIKGKWGIQCTSIYGQIMTFPEGLLKSVEPPASDIYSCQASGEKGVNIWE